MLSIQHIEESLSVSYVNAVISKTGRAFDIISKDYGVDGAVRIIESIGGMQIDVGAAFEFQLKATKNWSETETEIIYDMKAEAYNRIVLRNGNSTIPFLLVLMCLPREEKEWLCITENELILKKSCYFYKVTGNQTSNTSSIRLRIPKVNLFDCVALSRLVESIEDGSN